MKRIAQSWNRSGSGPAGPNKTGRKVHPAGRNRIFVSVMKKMNRTDFAGFFSIFLPDFCEISAGFLSV
jgi:hypothetical protein